MASSLGARRTPNTFRPNCLEAFANPAIVVLPATSVPARSAQTLASTAWPSNIRQVFKARGPQVSPLFGPFSLALAQLNSIRHKRLNATVHRVSLCGCMTSSFRLPHMTNFFPERTSGKTAGTEYAIQGTRNTGLFLPRRMIHRPRHIWIRSQRVFYCALNPLRSTRTNTLTPATTRKRPKCLIPQAQTKSPLEPASSAPSLDSSRLSS